MKTTCSTNTEIGFNEKDKEKRCCKKKITLNTVWTVWTVNIDDGKIVIAQHRMTNKNESSVNVRVTDEKSISNLIFFKKKNRICQRVLTKLQWKWPKTLDVIRWIIWWCVQMHVSNFPSEIPQILITLCN